LEDVDRLAGVALLGEDDSLEKARLGIAALLREDTVHNREGLIALSRLEQL